MVANIYLFEKPLNIITYWSDVLLEFKKKSSLTLTIKVKKSNFFNKQALKSWTWDLSSKGQNHINLYSRQK